MSLISAILLFLIAVFLEFLKVDDPGIGRLPLINGAKFGSLFSLRAKLNFTKHSKGLIKQGCALHPDEPFRVLTDWGEVLMLPPRFANEIRNHPHLSFTKAVSYDGHATIPGFETVKLISHPDNLIQLVARKQLTRHLSAVIRPLSEVTEEALLKNFGKSIVSWHEIDLKPAILDIIARLSSRIYFGKQLYQNDNWLSIVKNYASLFFTASSDLRKIPWIMRPIAWWLVPSCRELRSELHNARRLMQPYITLRRKLKKEANLANMPLPQFDDALEWAETEAQRKNSKYDPAVFQLTLSLLAIHTTYDLLETCMIDLAKCPECIPQLRKEVISALRKYGWTKTALYNMKLLDSTIKESQRLKPGSITSMRRSATADITLSNGLLLRKGERLNVLTLHRCSELYPSPDIYDPFRFYNIRKQPGNENSAQLVATSAEHMGFGHGEHSCPGRFFAANEIKVALTHILLKYDWQLMPGTCEDTELKGMVEKASGKVRMLVKRRAHIEISIDQL